MNTRPSDNPDFGLNKQYHCPKTGDIINKYWFECCKKCDYVQCIMKEMIINE